MIQINGEQVEEPPRARHCHRIAGVISVRPCVSAGCQASVGQQVKHTLKWIVFAAHEDHMFQGVGQSIIIICFRGFE